MKIETRIAKFWSDIPDVWKFYRKPRVQDYKPSPDDKELVSIIGGFAGTDDLRPAMTGIYFDDENIVTTDAHQLFILPNSGEIRGLYSIGTKKEIDAKFPNYLAVMPEKNANKYKVNISKLKTFCNVVINGKYSNPITKQLILMFAGQENRIAFNSEFLFNILTAFEKLNYTEVYIGINSDNRGAVFTVLEKDLDNISSAYGKRPVALLMPLMMSGNIEPLVSALDIDFQRELKVVYHLSDDRIINSDGKEVENWQPETDWGLPYWDIEEAKVFNKITNSKTSKSIPILERVKVVNKKLVATNLDLTYLLNDVDVEDGIYDIVNLALVDNVEGDGEIEDYPLDIWVNNEFLNKTRFNIGTGSIVEASKYVSDDELRPSMTGVHIQISKDISEVQGTDARSLFSVQNNEQSYVTNNVIAGSIDLLVPCLKTFFTDKPMFGVSENGNYLKFEEYRHSVYVKTILENYPKIDQVIPLEVEGFFNIDAEQLLKTLKELKLKGSEPKIQFIVSGNEITINSVLDDVIKNVTKVKGVIKKDTTYKKPKNFVGLMEFKHKDIDEGIMFDLNTFKGVINTAYKYGKRDGNNLSFSFDKKGLYLCELVNLDFSNLIGYEKKKEPKMVTARKPVEAKKTTEKPTKTEDKAQIMATINALKYIDNEDAKKTIKALKILLQSM